MPCSKRDAALRPGTHTHCETWSSQIQFEIWTRVLILILTEHESRAHRTSYNPVENNAKTTSVAVDGCPETRKDQINQYG